MVYQVLHCLIPFRFLSSFYLKLLSITDKRYRLAQDVVMILVRGRAFCLTWAPDLTTRAMRRVATTRSTTTATSCGVPVNCMCKSYRRLTCPVTWVQASTACLHALPTSSAKVRIITPFTSAIIFNCRINYSVRDVKFITKFVTKICVLIRSTDFIGIH